MKQKLW